MIERDFIDITELIKELKHLNIRSTNDVTLKSGNKSKEYFDLRIAYGQPRILRLMRDKVISRLDPRTTCVAGSGHGGIPLATAISLETDLNLIMVREEEKKHGKGGWFDGYIPNEEDKITLVDDIFSFGTSLMLSTQIIKEFTPAEIVQWFTILKRGDESFQHPLNYLIHTDFLKS